MKPEELLEQAEVVAGEVKRLYRLARHVKRQRHVLDSVKAIEDFADEVFNNLQDEARGDLP
jgi:uncharacterized protein Yka (UPF0111/DUF47 family)